MADRDPVSAFANKWGGTPLQADAPTAVATLQRIDLQRLKSGKTPLTASQTQRAIRSVATRQPVTPVPERRNPWSVWSNIVADTTDLVKGIPQLPMAIVNEARAFQDVPAAVAQAKAPGDVFELPGVRLMPGAFIASTALPGGRPATELATRPVSTVLDLLPFADAAVRLNATRALGAQPLPTAPAALGTQAAAEQARGALRQASLGDATLPIDLPRLQRLGLQTQIAAGEGRRLIPDLLFHRVDNLGNIARQPWLESFRISPTGQKLFQFAEGTRAFGSAIKRFEANQILNDMQTTVGPLRDRSIEWYNSIGEDAARFGIDADDARIQIKRAVADPDSFGVRTPDEAIPQLDPWMQEYARTYLDELLPELEAAKTRDYGIGTRESFIEEYDGAKYTRAEATRLRTLDARLDRAKANLLSLNPERFGVRLSNNLNLPDAPAFIEEAYRLFPDESARMQYLVDNLGRDGARQAAEWGQLVEDRAAMMNAATPEDLMLATARSTPRKRVSAGLLSPKEFRAYAEPIREVRSVAQRRIKAKQSVLNPTLYETGKRLFWERAKANYDAAQALDPALRQSYLDLLDSYPVGSPERRAALRDFRRAVGDDTWRLLQYKRPDVDGLKTPVSEASFRQAIKGFMSDAEAKRLDYEIRTSLNQLYDDGYRPAFVPGVAWEKAGRIDSTTIPTSMSSPDFTKSKTFDTAPMHPDLGVSVAYEAYQDWASRVAEPRMAELIRTFGIRGDDLFYQLEAAGVDAARRLRLSEAQTDQFLNDFANMAKSRGYVQYKPEEIFPTAKGLAAPTADFTQQIFLPREFDTLVRRMFSEESAYFQRLIDPLSKTFRTSVLLFSPAWHWNNIFSGALITAVTNPDAFRYIAKEWVDRGGWGRALSREGARQPKLTPGQERAGFGGVTGSLENDLISLARERGKIENSLARTRTATRLWGEIQQSKIAQGIVDRFTTFRDFSLGLNGFFDDLFRAANFDAFEAKILRDLADEGITGPRAEMIAAERALARTQTVFMDWTQMLPVERGILRAVFPFYAWSSHVMRLAFKLPFDHPLRVAVINAFTRAEIEDWQSRYPQIFRRILGFANPDTSDRFVGLNVDAFNPFRDVGNLVTMGGLVASSNPIIQQVFRSVGVDPMSGGPEYAPNFVYDPTAPDGQSLDSGNPIINLAGNIVPQSKAIARLLGMDSQFSELERTNPAAANRALMSGLRLPIVYRDVDVNETLAKEEVKRFNAYRIAAGQAKKGDSGELRRFNPNLADFIDRALADQQQAQQAEIDAMVASVEGSGAAGNPYTAASRQFVARHRAGFIAPVNVPSQFVTV